MIPDRQLPGRRRRRWDFISWWYSLILVIPLVALIVMVAASSDDDDGGLSGIVRDAFTGDPVSGAVVSTANATATTNDDGIFSVDDLTATALTISRDDYASTQVPVTSPELQYEITLRPTTIRGRVTNSNNDDPLAGVTVTSIAPDGVMSTTTTNEDGEYTLEDVPEGAEISVTYEGFTVDTRQLGSDTELDFEIRPDVLTGRIVDEAGKPVGGATVSIGTVSATTTEDGTFRLGAIPEDGDILVRKAGYHDLTADLPESLEFNGTLAEFLVRGIYVTAHAAADERRWQETLDLADTTEINAIVLDLKDSSGVVHYDTSVPLAEQVGAETARYDIRERLDAMHERDIYAIARIVVFEDPLLAAARNDLAIQDSSSGELWTTWNGLAWVNAHEREVWQYNIDLAVEAAELGFDEVQLDYIRFPSDGLLENADYGAEFAEETRLEAITGFLEATRDALKPTGALLAVDTFGITMFADDDADIGQNLAAIAPLVDVVCPMIYPSHFYPGTMNFDIPNDHPYDVVLVSLQTGADLVPEARDKLRPWLQDFSYGEGIEYGTDEVRAQIQATMDFGASGWMLWNPESDYSDGALEPE